MLSVGERKAEKHNSGNAAKGRETQYRKAVCKLTTPSHLLGSVLTGT